MKYKLLVLIFLFTSSVFASEAVVDIRLSPAGNFSAKTKAVSGFAKKVGTKVVAENITVNLKTLKTGIKLRDEHTLKHLDVENHPNAILVKAEGENGKGTGIIKIRNIEKSIKGTFKINGSNLLAEFPILLSDFKIEGIRYMGVGVKDQAMIKVNVPVK
jgi:hypothetical protein